MRTLTDEFVNRTGRTIWEQIKATATPDIIGSWGISELYSQELTIKGQHYAGLVMRVQGFQLNGFAIIILNEAQDLYEIYTAQNEEAELVQRNTEVYCDILVKLLDHIIEKGNMTEEQYHERIQQSIFSL